MIFNSPGSIRLLALGRPASNKMKKYTEITEHFEINFTGIILIWLPQNRVVAD